jgi:hypothetical protein
MVVDASQEVLYVRMSPASEPFEYKRTIRVTFPDGSTSEAEESILLRSVQRLADRRTIDCWPQVVERTKLGAIVAVRYDESDHSHIVLRQLRYVGPASAVLRVRGRRGGDRERGRAVGPDHREIETPGSRTGYLARDGSP